VAQFNQLSSFDKHSLTSESSLEYIEETSGIEVSTIVVLSKAKKHHSVEESEVRAPKEHKKHKESHSKSDSPKKEHKSHKSESHSKSDSPTKDKSHKSDSPKKEHKSHKESHSKSESTEMGKEKEDDGAVIGEVKCLKPYSIVRKDLQKWLKDDTNFARALDKYPFKRLASQAHSQRELVSSMRKNYVESTYNTHQEITFKTYRCDKFVVSKMDQKVNWVMPEISPGFYSKKDMCIVDFANSQLGGGFLTYGCAQEEVIVLERPDMCFTLAKRYGDDNPVEIKGNEVMIIDGAEKYVHMKFWGRVPDDWDEQSKFYAQPLPAQEIIAMDCIKATFSQYSRGDLLWLLRKAFTAFSSVKSDVITTGNWGCGAFDNNRNVIFCVQTIAAGMANKKLVYKCQPHDCSEATPVVRKWMEDDIPLTKAFLQLCDFCEKDAEWKTTYQPQRRRTTELFRQQTHQSSSGRKSMISYGARKSVIEDMSPTTPENAPPPRSRKTIMKAPVAEDDDDFTRRSFAMTGSFNHAASRSTIISKGRQSRASVATGGSGKGGESRKSGRTSLHSLDEAAAPNGLSSPKAAPKPPSPKYIPPVNKPAEKAPGGPEKKKKSSFFGCGRG